MEYLIGWGVVAPICAVFGALIGQKKGRAVWGALWGFILGPFGWLLMALVPDVRPKCPECGGVVIRDARKCKNCGSAI